jgi:type I restriction enzyme S subunit
MFLPNVQIQKQIIDIIEPHEQLFLRLSKCVRIDTAEHAKNDIKSLIDIIEPIEQLKNKLKLINKKIFQIAKIISSDYHFKERMKNKCKFIKGLNTKNFEIGETLFLNVSAANFKPNKYCNNKPNIHFGDITLSLDGTTGIVSKSLVGFNGYLYKIISNSYKNYEIYYSLLTNENQAIIKLNETGTTIKHSPNSKSQL